MPSLPLARKRETLTKEVMAQRDHDLGDYQLQSVLVSIEVLNQYVLNLVNSLAAPARRAGWGKALQFWWTDVRSVNWMAIKSG